LKRFIGLLVTCAFLHACAPSNQPVQLVFEDAWVRAMPPGSKMTAGFGRLVNTGADEMIIAGWSSDDFGNVSLHRTVTEDGISRMHSVSQLTISPDSEQVLEPGGLHLMFMRPVEADRQAVKVDIELSDGRHFIFDLPVERR
jgi:copper(I)-binding protein